VKLRSQCGSHDRAFMIGIKQVVVDPGMLSNAAGQA
jgi:hypothetical protein